METNSEKHEIWAISDGRAGNVAMAMGLAEKVAELSGGHAIQRDLQVNGVKSWLSGHFSWLSSTTAITNGEALPALVIGAGRRVAPAVASLRKTNGIKAVQILEPKMSLSRFDRVVIPQHDGVSGPNVLTTLGSLGRVSEARLSEAKSLWKPRFAHLPRPLMAVLLGGDTKRKKVTGDTWSMLINNLKQLSSGVGMVVTPSRRSGPDVEARLRQSLPEAMIWDGEGENPYFGMLACADCILVTDDSVNMASEAASTGKPLALYPLLQEGGKTARFHEALIAAHHAEMFSGVPTNYPINPLDETTRIAQEIAELL